MDCPEDTHSSENIFDRNQLFQPKQVDHCNQHRDSAYTYGVIYAARSSHVSHATTTPNPAQTVIESDNNRSHNQGQNSSCYERITTYRSCSYWNRMTHTANESSPGIYTLGDGQKRHVTIKRKEEKRKISTIRLLIAQKIASPSQILLYSVTISEF